MVEAGKTYPTSRKTTTWSRPGSPRCIVSSMESITTSSSSTTIHTLEETDVDLEKLKKFHKFTDLRRISSRPSLVGFMCTTHTKTSLNLGEISVE